MRKIDGDSVEIKFENEVYSLKKSFSETFGLELSLFDALDQKCATISIPYPKLNLNMNEILLKNYSENQRIAKLLLEKKILKPSSKYILVGRQFCPVCEVQNLNSIESY